MLQVNPSLQPDQVKSLLQDTATPMLGYSRYEVGAGYLNTYAAVRKAALNTEFGAFRKLLGTAALSLTRSSLGGFSGVVEPGATWTATFDIPADAVFATTGISWQNQNLPGNNLTMTLSHDATSVQGNVIAGINQTSSRASTTFGSSPFIAIVLGTTSGLFSALAADVTRANEGEGQARREVGLPHPRATRGFTGESRGWKIAALRGPGARGVLNLPSPACIRQGEARLSIFRKQKARREFAEPVFPNYKTSWSLSRIFFELFLCFIISCKEYYLITQIIK